MEIATGIHAIGQKQGGRVHAFLIDDGTDLILIDSLYDTDGRRLLDQIAALGKQATAIKHIVLTHGHRSHLGGVAALKRLTGATVHAHEWEADIIAGDRKAQPVTLKPSFPLRDYLPVYPFQLGIALGVRPHPPCPIDRTLKDGDRIGPLQVLHTPGHSPGHLAFYWPERRTLVAGDAVATWPVLCAGWPAFNLNKKQHRASLHRMAELDAAVVAVGHGPPLTTDAAVQLKDLARDFR